MAVPEGKFPPGVAPGSAAAVRLTELREEAYARIVKCFVLKPYEHDRSRLLTELREALFVSPDAHLEILEAGQRGEIPHRIVAAAAARGAPNAMSGASSNHASGEGGKRKGRGTCHEGDRFGAPPAGLDNRYISQQNRSATGASGPSRERNGGGTKQWGVPTGTQAATGGGGSGGGPHQHARNSIPTSAPPLEMHSGIGMDPSQYARAGGIQNGGWGGMGAAMGGMSYGAPDGLAPISTGAPPPDCSGSQTWTGLGMMQPANDQYMYGGARAPFDHGQHVLMGGMTDGMAGVHHPHSFDPQMGRLSASLAAAQQHLPYPGVQLPYLMQHQQQQQQQQQQHQQQQHNDKSYGVHRSAAFPPGSLPNLAKHQAGSKRSAGDASKPAAKRKKTLSAPPPNKHSSAAPTRVTSASAVGGGKGAAAAAATAAAPLGIEQLLINPLVGRKVETWYPDHGGWYPGIITDYNITNDKHCVCYDVGREDETFEWISVRRAKREDFRLLTSKVDVLTLPHTKSSTAKRSAENAAAVARAAAAAAAAAKESGSGGGGQRYSSGQRGGTPVVSASQALPSQQSQQTSMPQAPPPVTISVIPASAGPAGNVAAAPKAARPRAAGGTSKLKKLVGSTSGRAGAMASAARTGGVKPAKPAPHRAVPVVKSTPMPAKPTFIDAPPPKVAPPPRASTTSASRRPSESDDDFSDGLRGNMRDSPTPSRSPSPAPAQPRDSIPSSGIHPPQQNPYARDPGSRVQDIRAPGFAESPPRVTASVSAQQQDHSAAGQILGGFSVAAPRFAVKQLPPAYQNRNSEELSPSPPPEAPSSGERGTSQQMPGMQEPAFRHGINAQHPGMGGHEEAQGPLASPRAQVAALPVYPEVPLEHQFRIVSSSDDDSDSDTGGC